MPNCCRRVDGVCCGQGSDEAGLQPPLRGSRGIQGLDLRCPPNGQGPRQTRPARLTNLPPGYSSSPCRVSCKPSFSYMYLQAVPASTLSAWPRLGNEQDVACATISKPQQRGAIVQVHYECTANNRGRLGNSESTAGSFARVHLGSELSSC